MAQNSAFNKLVISNLFWFGASFAIAFIVWLIATNAADPIQERRLPQQFPVQILTDAELVLLDNQTRTTRVTVRAATSVINILTTTPEDVVVTADLRGRSPGTHTVELKVNVARQAVVVDTQPRQITITLDQVQSQQVEISTSIIAEPPIGFERGTPHFDEVQVLATGAASRVRQVIAAQALLDLSEQRSDLQMPVRLLPVDAEGAVVEGVALDPAVVDATIEVVRMENVREVSIRPSIDTDSLPEGYDLTAFTYVPQTVFVSGAAALIPELLETDLISLVNRRADFEISVPILVPAGRNLFILGDQREVTVTVSIAPRLISRTFDNIPVVPIGLGRGLQAETVPDQVTLVLNGPQVELENLSAEELEIALDLTGLGPGVYDRTPIAFSGQIQMPTERFTVSPLTVTVTITNISPPATELP